MPGFQTSVVALATLWKYSLYEKEKKIGNRERKVRWPGSKRARRFFFFRPITLLRFF